MGLSLEESKNTKMKKRRIYGHILRLNIFNKPKSIVKCMSFYVNKSGLNICIFGHYNFSKKISALPK